MAADEKIKQNAMGTTNISGMQSAAWGLMRISIGWMLLWGFLDKMFGLGFTTAAEKSWLDGVSPTTGFLKGAATGPFADIFHKLAGQAWVDWLFMLGLLLIGLSLIFGVGMKIATGAGCLLFALMFLAVMPPKHNPLIDEHIVYILAMIVMQQNKAGRQWGLGSWWSQTGLVKRHPILE
ncbi:MAG: hypothetical protein A3F54_03880 [Candidatus Kerfeldbacteria bacterium RIFCSPHIGHO2_12_FULL_48_17]|uniref:DoxX family protein n=1 Tax=Candidatus Kerfeldbacteria bacterium RIFCSPHIGHO2_12_FULL_48_17 TaxID=1798542 RepID=A0A1G2B538_9BACT|nr:MAG: hypothetical protein A3F54_03880 [Candidatus Kerfeldbacteria bacterium RIFCSPHIGHO2_12_FULL_48_17]